MAYQPIVELFRDARRSVADLRARLRDLIAAGEQIDAPTDHPSRKTPLQLAASNSVTDFGGGGWSTASHAAVDELLRLGAKVDVPHAKSGMQAIHYAARNASASIVGLLLEAGADPNATDDSGQRPIFLCLDRADNDAERFRVFCELLARGVDPRLKNASGRSLPQTVREERFRREVNRALLEWNIHGGAPFERASQDEPGEPCSGGDYGGMKPL